MQPGNGGMETLEARREALIREWRDAADPGLRVNRLLQAGRQRAELAPELRCDAHRVDGCLSRLWIVPEWRHGRCFFRCDSDALVVKALAGLICDFYSDVTPEAILAMPPDFVKQAGLAAALTANRRNAISRVWDVIAAFARRCGPGNGAAR